MFEHVCMCAFQLLPRSQWRGLTTAAVLVQDGAMAPDDDDVVDTATSDLPLAPVAVDSDKRPTGVVLSRVHSTSLLGTPSPFS